MMVCVYHGREVTRCAPTCEYVKGASLDVSDLIICGDCAAYKAERDEARTDAQDKLSAMREELELARVAMANMEAPSVAEPDAAVWVRRKELEQMTASRDWERQRGDDNWEALQTAKATLADERRNRDLLQQEVEGWAAESRRSHSERDAYRAEAHALRARVEVLERDLTTWKELARGVAEDADKLAADNKRDLSRVRVLVDVLMAELERVG